MSTLHLGNRPATRGQTLSVPVHPGAAAVEQDRAGRAVADGVVEGAADRGW